MFDFDIQHFEDSSLSKANSIVYDDEQDESIDSAVKNAFKDDFELRFRSQDEVGNNLVMEDEIYETLKMECSLSSTKIDEGDFKSQKQVSYLAKKFYSINPKSGKRKYSTYKCFTLDDESLIKNANMKFQIRVAAHQFHSSKFQSFIEDVNQFTFICKETLISKQSERVLTILDPKFKLRINNQSYLSRRRKIKRHLQNCSVLRLSCTPTMISQSNEVQKWNRDLDRQDFNSTKLRLFAEKKKNKLRNISILDYSTQILKIQDRFESLFNTSEH